MFFGRTAEIYKCEIFEGWHYMRSEVTPADGNFSASQHDHCFGRVKRLTEFLSFQVFWCQSIPSSKSLPVHLPHGFYLAATT